MSWEGYYQVICKNGHYFHAPDPFYGETSPCKECGAEDGWTNMVDETNCDSYGIIPYNLLVEKYLISEQVVETCNLGHKHVTQPALFRVPGDEAKQLQHYSPQNAAGEKELLPIAIT